MPLKWDRVNDKHICYGLVKLETENPVSRMRFGGIHVWPVLKLLLYTHLYNSKETRLGFTAPHLTQTIREIGPEAKATLASLHPDMLCFSMPFEYREGLDGLYRDRFYDPLILNFGDKYSFCKLECISPGTERTMPRLLDSCMLQPITVHRPIAPVSDVIPGYKDIAKAIEAQFGVTVDERVVIQECLDVQGWRRLFHSALDAAKPKAALCVCYYHAPAMGLAKACRDKKISLTEYQHGWQDLHPFYSHMAAVPKEGFDTVPDNFWVWNSYGAENIQHWREISKTASHVPLVGGHPYFDTFFTEAMAPTENGKTSAFLRRVKAAQRVILVSLCPLDGVFPGNLYQAIEMSPPGWLWLLRQHPSYYPREGDIRPLLPQHRLQDIDAFHPNTLPLPTLLAHATHHVSPFSGTVAEALYCRVPSILTHQRGKHFFENLIRAGLAVYAPRPEQLLAAIASERVMHSLRGREAFFPDSLAQAAKTLKRLLAPAEAAKAG